MDTSGIKIGDIIKVDDGLQWYGLVYDLKPVRAQLLGKTLQPPRKVKPRDIIGHWRKSKATTKRERERVTA
jgi:hypothetical protein